MRWLRFLIDLPGAVARRAQRHWPSLAGAVATGLASLAVLTAASAAISYVSASEAYDPNITNTLSVSRPSGVASGDVLLAAVTMRDTNTINTPSGWTPVVTSQINSLTNPNLRVFYRVAGGSEPASYTFTTTGSESMAVGVAAFRGIDTSSPIAASAVQANNTASTSGTAPSVTPGMTGAMLVSVWATHDNGGDEPKLTVPASMTRVVGATMMANNTAETRLTMAREALTAGTATGTRTATLSSSYRSNTASIALRPTGYTVGGTVFEDVNYGGGAGRSLVASGGVGVNGATVELYSGGVYVSSTTTAGGGAYSFTGVTPGSYQVRVVGSSVPSQRTGSVASLRGVMTYRTDASSGSAAAVTSDVGGTNPAVADAAAGSSGATFNTGTGVFSAVVSGTAQSFAPVTVSGANIGSVDFGFNFDTVVNTNDSGTGSLRQAITNANALGGDASLAQSGRTAAIENLVFMIGNGSAAAGLRSANNSFATSAGAYNVATITPTSALPALSSAMVIDAQTQPGWTANPLIELRGDSAGNVMGLTLSASGSTVRGLVVNRFAPSGIHLSASGNTVQGCWVGLNAAGSAAAGNGSAGIYITAGGNTVGGTTATLRNVVSGNGSGNGTNNAGILVASGTGNTVQGNYVGLNAAGTALVANWPYGIDVSSAANTIGGSAAGAGNVSSGHQYDGIILRPGSDGTTVQGNILGGNAANTAALGNSRRGITIQSGSNTIGGTAAGAGNVIRGQGGAGLDVEGNVNGNAVLGNSIFGNAGIGIDLGGDGQTTNDGVKSSGQPNLKMDYPVFTSASLAGTTLSVAGYVGSAAGQSTFASSRVEVFISDGSNTNGQGQTYLGYLTADASGNFSGTLGGVAGVTTGSSKITGTATDTANNTSEFGPNLTVASLSLSGTVFEDVNYGGGAGRSLAASSGAGVTGASVELYSATGNHVASTTTAAGGGYAFAGVQANTSYFVRVAGPTVASTRSGSTASLVGVLTWRTTAASGSAVAVTDAVGGTNPALIDPGAASSGAAFNTTTLAFTSGPSGTAQAVTPAAVVTSNVSGIDFGFNFDTVVNTNDSGAGSLRQAIVNANALGGDAGLAQAGRTAAIENLVFMIGNGSAGSGLRSAYNFFTTSAGSYSVATLVAGSAYPAVSAPLVIDAQTQAGWTLAPLLEINANSLGTNLFTLSGGSSTLRGFVVNRLASSGSALRIDSAGSNTVQGNWFGPDAAGATATVNGGQLVQIYSGGNLIGGSTASARNVISRGSSNGVVVWSGSGNTIQGNYIGTNAAGSAALGSNDSGIVLPGTATNTVIGGGGAGEGNLISGNLGSSGTTGGISIQTAASTGTVIRGNRIGLNAAGTAAIASGSHGIYVAAASTTIGGTAAGAGNTITGHAGKGVAVVGSATSGVAIQGNSIYGNTGIGIDLGNDGQTNNDGAKTASQPNLLMDQPVFTLASLGGTTLTVQGYVGSAAGQSIFGAARVEVFISDLSNANGQGKTYLGFVTADASGNFSGTVSGVAGITAGTSKLTGTATDGSGNTSEFGPNSTVMSLTLSGTVFEDVNYGGGAGRSLAASGGAGVAGATVELYGSGGAYIASTTSAAGGGYSFTGVQANTGYFVRVAGPTVASTRSGSTASLVGVLTWRTTAASGSAVAVTDSVGGTNPALADPGAASSGAAFNTTTLAFTSGPSGTAQAVAPVAVVASSIGGVDFGFNFDTVVNTNGSGAGSLRQAIVNANTLGSDASLAQAGRTAAIENIVFMLGNGTADGGLRSAHNFFTTNAGSYNVATITPATALPTVTAPLVIDAQMQPGWTLAPLIELNGASAGSVSGLTLNAAGSTLRGLVINRFGIEGVTSTSGAGLVIQGNYIGTDAAGSAASANANSGIWLNSSAGGHQIGGTTAAQRNVIAGQAGFQGVAVFGGSGSAIQGNYIGTNAAGTAVIANGSDGVKLYGGVTNSTVGGTVAGAGNLIRGNGGRGVNLLNAATGNAILGNSIHGNASIGIDLGNNGQTGNDGVKTSGRANLEMDYPVFTSASLSGTTLSVAGYVGSAPGQSTFASARVEVFVSDASNTNGQGQTYLGYLTADASGNFSGTISGVSGITTGSSRLTGTATDASNNTSEFGPNVLVGSAVLSGTVFDDVNYGGGAGRGLATATGNGGSGVAGATVELYSSSGAYLSSTTTTAGGGYFFGGVPTGASYFVRVAGPTVASTRSGSTGSLVGVLTYRTTAASGSAVAVTDHVGGTNPALADPAAASGGAAFNTSTFVYSAGLSGTAQAVAPVSAGGGDIAGIDFGFNFDTVVNTNNAGAGSLRQAMTNANTLGGDASLAQSGRTAAVENIVFMISNGSAGSGLRGAYNFFTTSAGSYNVATITPTSALPTVSSAIVIDAQAQPGWTLAPLIELNGSSAGANVSGLYVTAANTTVRGFVINRFGGEGIDLVAASGFTLQGNYIGTNAAGSAASANTKSGVWIHPGSSTGHLVGGTTAAQRNVISGNTVQGVAITNNTGAVVSGNFIGVNAAGTATIGNASAGVLLYASVQSATVGGIAAGAGNVVAGNGAGGVVLVTGATGNAVLGNSIYGNAYIGIDLGANGQTTNDGVKTSGRANLEMDYPVFTSASLAGTTLSVAGYVGSAAGQSVFGAARVEVFISDAANTNGQGKTYLGTLTADASGNFSGTVSAVSGITTGTSKITGTATDTSNNTSEFGPNLTVASLSLAGTVFEDVNYGGGAGRSLAASGGAGVAGATVELYDAAGSYVSATTSAVGGGYSFPGLAANSAYFVRVVGPTVASTRSGGSTAGLVAVLTYRSTGASGSAVAVTDMVGGTNPGVADPGGASSGASFNTASFVFGAGLSGTAQAVAPASVGVSGIAGLDFGFNFDTVVNTSDSGAGSLRQAITNANTLGGDAGLAQGGRTAAIENIVFMLPNGTAGGGLRSAYNAFATSAGAYNVATLTPASALPTLTTPMVVDAQAQPGWSAVPLLEVRGNAAGNTPGLTVAASGVVLRGLIVNRFSGHGISVTSGGGTTVQGCWIGTTAAGTAAAANSGSGVAVAGSGNGQQIGGSGAAQRNVISGNGGYGIALGGSGGGHLVQGNHVGTNAAGDAAVGNAGRGVFVDSAVTSATLGGAVAGAGNVISGNPDYAVWLAGGATTVQGNTIGLNAAGTAALANGYGIFTASGGHQIGGTSAAARNVVSGNTARGIWLNSAGNTVQGNHVGTNAAGTAALANTDGIYSKGANNVIGGTAAGAGNLVSGNSAAGILLNAIADGTVVQGNVVGRNAAGTAALANAVGVNVQCSSGCAIGGTAAGAGNTISGNSGNGVQVAAGSSGNAILGNAIWGNGGLGIDLNNDGVSANDGAKTNGQANLLMDSPVLSSARARGSQLTVAGYVGSAAGQNTFGNARVELFASDNDASGYGEGKTYLGAISADASGNFSGTLTMPPAAALAIGSKLTATATDGGGNTSEFGANFSALVVDLVVNSNLDEADSSPGDGSCLTASGVCTLRAAIAELNAQTSLAGTPAIVFAIPGCSGYGAAGCRIAPAGPLPSLTRSMAIDATTQGGWNAATLAPIVELNGAATAAGTAGLVLAADGSSVRGLVVNSYNGPGITLAGNGNLLAGNWVGLDNAGTAGAGNTGANGYGVRITGSNNIVGGTTAADANVIAANAQAGVAVLGGSGNAVRGNTLGRAASGGAALSNGIGVLVGGGANSAIGGTASGAGNLISGNGRGVVIGAGSGHSVLGNAIHGNSVQGIDLGNDGVSANDGAYNAGQPNQGIDTPVVTGAGIAATGTSMTVYGGVGSSTGVAVFAGARIEFFKAAPDATGYGQGQLYLGSLTADASGAFNGSIAIAAGSIAVGDSLTATATDSSGNSSEFAANWVTTTTAALTPAGFNAFDDDAAAGATSGVLRSRVAGSPSAFAVVALDSAGTGLHPGYSGTVALRWLDARNDSGAVSGSCRASWLDAGSAGSVVFSANARVSATLTPPASATRVMRLMMVASAGGGGSVVACSNDAFAALPASLVITQVGDADAASAGSTRTLANLGASGGAVHRAGRPFTVLAQARAAGGALMTGYDGTPVLAISSCLLPSACTAGTLGGNTVSAAAGSYSNATVTYAEVGAVTLQLTDASYAAVDAADTPAVTRTLVSAAVGVGRFVPDSLSVSVSAAGQLATANAACMASGQAATFLGQGFGWAAAPQVTVTALNAAGATTVLWTGALMKLGAAGAVPALAVSGAGSAGLSRSYGAVAVSDLGAGRARLTASSSDRFLLEMAAGAVQPTLAPGWAWSLAINDASEAGVAGNPTLAATAQQGSVAFDQGGQFHSGRLALAASYGDARSGVAALVQLQRYTAAGWVTLTEDRGCVVLQPQHVAVETPSGVFAGAAGDCAAPMAATATTAGGRAWLRLPATPGAAPGRLRLRLAGGGAVGAGGHSCSAGGTPAALAAIGAPWLMGGSAANGPAAMATWGTPQRDAVLRRETW